MINIDDTTGGAIAIQGDQFRQQVTLRITGDNVWINFNAPAVVGEGVYIQEGDSARFHGERATANIYMVCDTGESAIAYFVNGKTNMEITPGSQVSSGGSRVQLLNEVNQLIDVQHPLPTDGDSVYEKDVWVEESDNSGWTGDVVSLFNDLHTVLNYVGTDNPKSLFIHFKRTVVSTAIGLGCSEAGGNFSNVKIEIINSGGVGTTVIDESSDSTKYTSRTFQLPATAGFNAIRFTFATADDVCLTNCVILKTGVVVARTQGVKPDGTVVDYNATQQGNQKMSLEEFENNVSEDNNTSLRVAPILVDEFGKIGRMLSDNMFVGAPVVLASEHHEIHCGDSYEATHNVSLGNNASLEFLITVPDWGTVDSTDSGQNQLIKVAHLVGVIEAESELSVQFFEAPTVTTPGTAITSHNRNFNSSFTDYLGITQGGSVSADGTSKWGPWRVGAGRSEAGSASRNREFVLKNNTIYLLRITNQTTATNNVNVEFDYYIHPGV